MLIIEVDGITHQWEEVAANDLVREKALKGLGFTVLRFDDDDVLTGINEVYNQIEDFIMEFESRKQIHPLHPRQRGRLDG